MLRPVLLLAFGLVFLTVVAVGYLMHWLIPALPLAAAFALGAIVSPADAVAVAALSIPLSTASGEAFPGRDLIIFLAATTIVLTLVVNGLTLPGFIRLHGVRGDRRAEQEQRAARLATAQAAIDALQREASRLSDPDRVAAAQGLLARYGQRLARHSANAGRRADLEAQEHDERRLALVALAAEQAELQSLRDTSVINDQTLRRLQVDLDHAEAMLRGAPRNSH